MIDMKKDNQNIVMGLIIAGVFFVVGMASIIQKSEPFGITMIFASGIVLGAVTKEYFM
jgi:hypothetical protein